MTIIHIASCSKGYGFDPDDLIQFEKKMCVCTLPLRLDIRGLYHYISLSDTSIITFLPFEHDYLPVRYFSRSLMIPSQLLFVCTQAMTSQFMEVMLRSSGLPYCIQLSRFSCSMPLWPYQDSVRRACL